MVIISYSVSHLVIDTSAVSLMSGEQAGGSYVSGMACIGSHIGHGGHYGSEHHVPALGRIFIYSHLYGFKHLDGLRQCHQC